jgi:biotin carboxyl carrier protein
MRYFIRLAGSQPSQPGAEGAKEYALEVLQDAAGFRVRDEQGERAVSLTGSAGSYRVLIDGRVIDLSLNDLAAGPNASSQSPGIRTVEVFGLGLAQTLQLVSERDRVAGSAAGIAAASQRSLLAQMPGRVLQVRVQAGQRVAKGTALLVMEAMKMENELYADTDLTVVSVAVKTGDAVEMGAQLLVVEC